MDGQEDVRYERGFTDYFSMCSLVTPRKLFQSMNSRSVFVVCWVVASIYTMNIFNAFAYSRMPGEGPLPDVIADAYKNYGGLRNSRQYMGRQPADVVSLFLTAASIITTLIFWDKVNARKMGVVYCLCLLMRTLFFSVTGLPPTCIGYPNCPCETTPYAKVASAYSLPTVAAIYTFSMGFFLDRFPQCGDLTMSGHTIYLWIVALYFTETLQKTFKGLIVSLIKVVVYVLLTFVLITIVLIRNHYTIDVFLATIFTNMLWTMYSWSDHLLRMDHQPFVKSYVGRAFKWIENVYAEADAL